jgi:PAS domain-containing protein
MKSGDETLLMPAPAWDDPRVHLLDDIWLLAIFTILLAIVLPWFVSAFVVDLVRAAWGLLGLGAVHIAFTIVCAPNRPATVWRSRSLGILHALGIAIIGYTWLHAGGLQNPMFLIVFALPVASAVFISRWQPYLMALLAIAVVMLFSLAQSPELRWYANGLNSAGAWLADLFGSDAGSTGGAPFPGFYAPAGYFVVLLEVFAILMFACAFAAEHLGSVFERLYAHVTTARAEAARGQELWAKLIESLPVPALLVDSESSQIICASERVASAYCALDAQVAGTNLYETIRFSYPEVVQELIAGLDGTAPLTMIRVAEAIRVTELRVQHVAQKGRRFALVIIADTTEEYCMKAALDTADHASLVVDAQGRVLALNKPAAALFPGTSIGADTSRLLVHAGLTGRWWESQLAGRRRMHVEIGPRLFQVTLSTLALPGEEERVHVIAFLPVAKGSLSDQTMSTTRVSTAVMQP